VRSADADAAHPPYHLQLCVGTRFVRVWGSRRQHPVSSVATTPPQSRSSPPPCPSPVRRRPSPSTKSRCRATIKGPARAPNPQPLVRGRPDPRPLMVGRPGPSHPRVHLPRRRRLL
jgi:hypothetical protein